MYIYYVTVEFHNGDNVHFKEFNKSTLLNKLIRLFWFEYYKCIPKKSNLDQILWFYTQECDHVYCVRRRDYNDVVEQEFSV